MWAGCRVMCRDYVIDCNSVTSKQIVSSTLLAMFEPLFLSFCPRIFCEISCCCVTILATTPRVNLALPHSFMQTETVLLSVAWAPRDPMQIKGLVGCFVYVEKHVHISWLNVNFLNLVYWWIETSNICYVSRWYVSAYLAKPHRRGCQATSNEANMWHTFHHTHWYNQL
jgi:hypothetical protein